MHAFSSKAHVFIYVKHIKILNFLKAIKILIYKDETICETERPNLRGQRGDRSSVLNK